jgi:hypothetical protein
MTTPVRLRPHHVLCSIGFEGKGYSDAFSANMTAIVMGQLRAINGTDTQIEIVSATDDICAPCPKRRATLCTSQEKIDRLDAAHAAALDLAPGDHLSWADAVARVQAHIQPDDLDRLCAGCEWLEMGMCKSAIARLQSAP